MLSNKFVNFQYKGVRDYVHGTDIFNELLLLLHGYFGSYPDKISGMFHKMLHNNGEFFIYEDAAKIEKDVIYADFIINFASKDYFVSLLDADSPVGSSYEYDEDVVLKGMVLSDKTIMLPVKTDYTYIEQIVAMTKKLHYEVYPADNINWLFTKFTLIDVIAPRNYDGRPLSVIAEKNFHNKLTKNIILLDYKHIGEIWFSHRTTKGN